MDNSFGIGVLLIVLTILVFLMAKKLQQVTGLIFLNPILVSMLLIMAGLWFFGISFDKYHESSQLIEWLLKPAVVALGYPLYLYWETIRKQAFPILLSLLVGSVVGLFSVVLMAKALGLSKELILSLAPKSVTSAIAIEISRMLGGIPSLAAGIAILVGILGAMLGYPILQFFGVKNPVSQALSIGNASHGIGTSRSVEIGQRFGAMSTIGLIVNAVLTSLLAPWVIGLLENLGWI
jgi:predicted murein hydrolase (TIGR00659 family)